MQLTDAAMQDRILKFDNPTFGYRRGENGEIEKDVFEGEPLPDGWVDSPAKVEETHYKPSAPVVRIVAPPENVLAPPYADHKFNDLKSELKRRTGKGPQTGTNKVTLIQMLEELDAAG